MSRLWFALLSPVPVVAKSIGKAPVPPMGWMDWEMYRCDIDEAVIRNTTDIMVTGGWLDAGYDTVHIDDCWAQHDRDEHGRLVANATRFPSGMKALVDWVHSRGMKFGIYSAAALRTCAKFQPGCQGYEAVDAQTFVEWGVDYLKFDACQDNVTALGESYYAMGAALRETPIVYACSWGAKGGPIAGMVDAGCDLWRLWHDIEAKKGWSDVVRISEHWADQADAWRNWSGPPSTGRGWHDPNQLLMGDDRLSAAESIAQLGLWSILSAPLILGNRFSPDPIDPSVVAAYQNPELISIARDPLAAMGGRLGRRSDNDGGHEVWARNLSDGAVAVLLWNKETPDVCTWEMTRDTTTKDSLDRLAGYVKASFNDTRFECCSDPRCQDFTFEAPGGIAADVGKGALYGETAADVWLAGTGVARFSLRSRPEASAFEADLSVDFSVLSEAGLWASPTALVRDILGRKDLGVASGKVTAKAVPNHGVALLKLTPVAMV